jgi:hypothetical protein
LHFVQEWYTTDTVKKIVSFVPFRAPLLVGDIDETNLRAEFRIPNSEIDYQSAVRLDYFKFNTEIS